MTHFAWAREFNFTGPSQSGTYLQGTGGPSQLYKAAYDRSDVSFANEVKVNYTLELGYMAKYKGALLSLGLMVVRAQAIEGAQATLNDVTQYRVSSSLIGYGPEVGLDLILLHGHSMRFYVFGSGAYLITTLKNDYALTTDGQGTYAVPDYTEEGTAYAYLMQGGLGYEVLFADNVSLALSVGYRVFSPTNFTHTRSHTNLDGTSISEGQTMKNKEGTNLALNLNGAFGGFALRFYIP